MSDFKANKAPNSISAEGASRSADAQKTKNKADVNWRSSICEQNLLYEIHLNNN